MRRLLIRPGGIGDCLLCMPAMQRLNAVKRAAYTEVWCPTPVVPLMAWADHAEAIIRTGLDSVGIPCLAPPASVVERLRGFDQIVSWYGTNRHSFQEAVYRLGLPFEFRPALPTGQDRHAVDFFLGEASGEYPRLDFVGGRPPEVEPWLAAADGLRATGSGAGETGSAYPRRDAPQLAREPRMVIHPFSGSPPKNWPLDRFRAAAGRLPLAVNWSAGPEEYLTGATRFAGLDELARHIASAALYIGNDSGITHLAAATGTPVIVLFGGASNPRVWAPRGDHVRVIAAESLEAIFVDTVVEEAHRLLARP